MATCNPFGEVGDQWGPCVGAVLPNPTATSGPAACDCFSEGEWHIDNLVPYFITYNGDAGPTIALSTTQAPDGGETVYPVVTPTEPDPPPEATANWSTDELTVNCAGTFTLCYDLKYGDFNNPLPTDCSIFPNGPILSPEDVLPGRGRDPALPVVRPVGSHRGAERVRRQLPPERRLRRDERPRGERSLPAHRERRGDIVRVPPHPVLPREQPELRAGRDRIVQLGRRAAINPSLGPFPASREGVSCAAR